MTLADVSSVGSLISGLAVLGSLVYLSLQTRQATKHTRALIQQGRADRSCETSLCISDPVRVNAQIAGSRGDPNIDGAQYIQFIGAVTAVFVNQQDVFLQHHDGLLPASAYVALTRAVSDLFTSPGYRAAWKLLRHRFDPEFVSLMDSIARDARSAPRQHTLAVWKALVAEEANLEEHATATD